MGKIDSFFVLVILLVSGLAVTYKAAEYDLSGIQFQKMANAILTKRILELELKQKELEIALSEKKTSLKSSFVSSNMKKMGARHIASSSVSDASDTSDEVVKNLYDQAAGFCDDSKKKLACLEKIEILVEQFPESKWSGEALVLLIKVNLQSQKKQNAKELMHVVKTQFSQDQEIMAKINTIESGHF